MARERKNSKVRDLEGINRQLSKKLKQAYRDNARLQKILERREDSEDPESEPIPNFKPERLKCSKCGAEAKMLKVQVRGVEKQYLICQDNDEHRVMV